MEQLFSQQPVPSLRRTISLKLRLASVIKWPEISEIRSNTVVVVPEDYLEDDLTVSQSPLRSGSLPMPIVILPIRQG